MILQIPLSDAPAQEIDIALSGVLYTLRMRLNYRMQLWTLDLLTPDKEPIVYGALVLPGMDLMLPYSVEGLGVFIAVNLNERDGNLSVDNLSQGGGLYYVV